jgi:hypothetical protein
MIMIGKIKRSFDPVKYRKLSSGDSGVISLKIFSNSLIQAVLN